MTIGEMLEQSAILTLLGMCVVFAFLVILIGCMNLLRKFVEANGLNKEEESASASAVSAPVAAAAPAVDTNAVVAAIATALHDKDII